MSTSDKEWYIDYFNHMEEEYGVEYPSYRLEEIENWVDFIDEHNREERVTHNNFLEKK